MADSVCSSPCVGLLPRSKISFFLLSIFVDELISIPTIITFQPVPPLRWEKNSYLSNLILYPEYLCLSISAFLVKLTAPNEQFSSVASLLVLSYLINNVNVYYFSVSVCNFILLWTTSTESYFCFSTQIV